MENISGIYCIENKINGKKYIGRDKKVILNRRWYSHISKLRKDKHTNQYLQSSWNKYGEENFEYKILEYCSEAELDEREIYYISLYKSNNEDFGYNLTKGGDGNHGWVPSEETKMKISISHMGDKNPMYGKKLNEKQRKAFLKNGEEHPFYGKHRSNETKQKLREKFLKEKSPVFGTKKKDSASLFYGVVIYNQTQRVGEKTYKNKYWKAQLRVDKTLYRLGYFKEEIEAAKKYDKYIIDNNLKNPLNFPRWFYKLNLKFLFLLYSTLLGRKNVKFK